MILCTDLHFNKNNYKKVSKILEDALKLASEKCCSLAILGDTNDTKANLRGETLNSITRLFNKFSDIPKHILIGNHDLLNVKNDKLHSLEILKELPNTYVYDNNQSLEDRILGDIAFIPYKNDMLELKDEIIRCKSLGIKVLLMHQGIKGAKLSKSKIDSDGFTQENLQDFLVLVGHYHLPHKLGNTIHYIGSSLSHSFSESNQKKYFYYLDIKTKIVDKYPTNSPQHIVYHLNQEDKNWPNVNHNDCDIVKLVISGTKEWIKDLNIDKIKSIYGENVIIDKTYTSITKKVTIDKTANKLDLLNNFIQNQTIPNYMKDIMFNKVKSIYENL